LAQALVNAACRRLIHTRYARPVGICEDLRRARADDDGSYFQVMGNCKGVQLLIVNDFMTTPVPAQNAVDLFEFVEVRKGRRSTLITSQLKPNEWCLRIVGELMADSILNRIATAARYVDLEGPNMRKYIADLKK
jgi:DNA replication protein DnaC